MNASLSLKTRLTCVMILLAMLCIAVAGVGINGIQNANERARHTYETLTRPGQAVESWYRISLTQVIQFMEVVASNDESTRQQRLDFIAQLQHESDAQIAEFHSSLKDDSIKMLSAEIEQNQEKFSVIFRKALELLKEGKTDQAHSAIENDARPYGIALFKATAQFNSILRKEAEMANERDIAAYRRIMTIMVGIIVAGGLSAGGYAWIELRQVGLRIGGLQKSLQEVNETLDLTHRAPFGRPDEIGVTAQAFNRLMERVSDVIGTVHGAVESVATASKEIASGNADLSSRTERQAASLQETATNMEELADAVQQNAENAREAAMLAASASQTAIRGKQVVIQAINTMHEISESSVRIADITSMIEGIAFQTNILALNAAVEAARAGEQGRGFAVVAAEVRSLAQRASGAAKEISNLIAESVARVNAGSKQVHEAGDAIREIVQSVIKVADLMQEIATASDEQNRGISQIGQAVAQMDEVTQQNAALVEQATAAAQSMDDQARSLRDAVAIFKLRCY